MLDFFLNNGILDGINEENFAKIYPTQYSVMSGNISMMNKFVAATEFDLSCDTNDNEWNAYHFALQSESDEMIEEILKRGVRNNHKAQKVNKYKLNMICSILANDDTSLIKASDFEIEKAYSLSIEHNAKNCLQKLMVSKIDDLIRLYDEGRSEIADAYIKWQLENKAFNFSSFKKVLNKPEFAKKVVRKLFESEVAESAVTNKIVLNIIDIPNYNMYIDDIYDLVFKKEYEIENDSVESILEYLENKNENFINTPDKNGLSLFMYAIVNSSIDIIKLLLEEKADIFSFLTVDGKEKSIFDFAKERGDEEITSLIAEQFQNAFINALNENDMSTVTLFQKPGLADAIEPLKKKPEIINNALKNNEIGKVQFLLENNFMITMDTHTIQATLSTKNVNLEKAVFERIKDNERSINDVVNDVLDFLNEEGKERIFPIYSLITDAVEESSEVNDAFAQFFCNNPDVNTFIKETIDAGKLGLFKSILTVQPKRVNTRVDKKHAFIYAVANDEFEIAQTILNNENVDAIVIDREISESDQEFQSKIDNVTREKIMQRRIQQLTNVIGIEETRHIVSFEQFKEIKLIKIEKTPDHKFKFTFPDDLISIEKLINCNETKNNHHDE